MDKEKKNQVFKGSNSDPKGHEKEKEGLILLRLLTEKNKRDWKRDLIFFLSSCMNRSYHFPDIIDVKKYQDCHWIFEFEFVFKFEF